MTKQKYVMACIRLPLEVFENGKYDVKNENVSISFEKCHELPPKKDLGEYNLHTIFQSLHIQEELEPDSPPTEEPDSPPTEEPEPTPTEEPEPTIFINKEEIPKKRREPSKNSSFKNRNNPSHRFTSRNRISTI
jgi:hypothetical protein